MDFCIKICIRRMQILINSVTSLSIEIYCQFAVQHEYYNIPLYSLPMACHTLIHSVTHMHNTIHHVR